MAGLNKALGAYLLAEQGLQSPAEAQNSLAELLRKADGRSRLLGLRGLEVVDSPNLSNLGGGVLLARAIEVNADGRIRVKVEFKAKEKLFSAGEVLVSTGVSLPLAAAEIRRKLEYLNQATAERLTQAGWIPEKISPEGVPPDALMALMGQLSGKRGGVRIGVVALDNLYPTETPKLGLQIVP